jgi:hypothetical protein
MTSIQEDLVTQSENKNFKLITYISVVCAFGVSLLISDLVNAAVPTATTILSKPGFVRGGTADGGYSLLSIRRTASKKLKTERIVIDIGDITQSPLLGKLGYYNVELKKNNSLVIDFAQTLNSKFSLKTIKEVIKGSPAIRSAKIHFEPTGQTMSLVFDLKKNTTVKVLPISGEKKQAAKMVLDLVQK